MADPGRSAPHDDRMWFPGGMTTVAARGMAVAFTLGFFTLGWTGCPRVAKPGFEKETLPPDLGREEGTVGLATTASLLVGPRALGRPGDWVVRNHRIVAVFRRQDGRLVDLGLRREGRDLFAGLATVVSDTRGRYPVYYHLLHLVDPPAGLRFAGATPKGKILELLGRVRDKDLDLEVRTAVWAPPGASLLVLRTRVRNAGREPVIHVGIGDDVYFGNSRLFVPGHGLVDRSAVLHASWVGREAPEHGFALATAEPVPMRLRFRVYSPGFNPLVQATYRVRNLAWRQSFVATRYLLLERGPLARVAALVQKALGGRLCSSTVTRPRLSVEPPVPVLEVSAGGQPVLRSKFRKQKQEILLVASRPYRARLMVPGVGPGPWTTVACAGHTELRSPAFGTLSVTVQDEAGRALPARLLLQGRGESPTPDFGPDGTPAGIRNVVYAWRGSASFLLAPGTYVVSAFHGLRRQPAWASVRVTAGSHNRVRLQLRPVGDSTLVSADFHLHASPSSDSPLSLKHRLAQLACAGVQVAVATDHNAVTDYGPAQPKGSRLQTFAGVEVTTARSLLGHFNVFPLPPDTAPPLYRNAPFPAMLRAWRALPGHPVVQVNHPRLTYMGYLNQVDFDPGYARPFAPGFRLDLDAMEVFNGTRLHKPGKVGQTLRDWFLLLNLDSRITATGNSDSHRLAYQEAGYPRNLLLSPKGRLDARALAETVRRGRLTVSSGPVVEVFRPGGSSAIGAQVRGPLDLGVRISAACHLRADRLVLFANGLPRAAWSLDGAHPMPMPLDNFLKSVGATGESRPGSFVAELFGALSPAPRPWPPRTCRPQDVTVKLRLAPERDTWYVFVAYSRLDNPSLSQRGALVAGFGNPVWVDADGDGRFQPSGPPPEPPHR